MEEQNIQTAIDSVPELGLWLLIAGLVVGLILWMLGRRLLRPVCAMSGLLIGGASSFMIAREMGTTQSMQLALSVAGAVAGCAIAWLMFRLWMGLCGGIVLAAAASLSLILIDQIPLPEVSLANVHIEQTEADTADDEADNDDAEAVDHVDNVIARAKVDWTDQADTFTSWWQQRETGQQTGILFAAAIGAVVGVIAGLLWPFIAASWQSALIGGTLIFFTGVRLAERWAGESTIGLPDSPAARIGIVGLITLLGVLLQWTIFRKPADK